MDSKGPLSDERIRVSPSAALHSSTVKADREYCAIVLTFLDRGKTKFAREMLCVGILNLTSFLRRMFLHSLCPGPVD
jgi:hypothetical protein